MRPGPPEGTALCYIRSHRKDETVISGQLQWEPDVTRGNGNDLTGLLRRLNAVKP